MNFGNDDAVSTPELGVTVANIGWSVAKELGVNRVTIQYTGRSGFLQSKNQAGAKSLGERTSRRVTEQLIAKPALLIVTTAMVETATALALTNAHTIASRPMLLEALDHTPPPSGIPIKALTTVFRWLMPM